MTMFTLVLGVGPGLACTAILAPRDDVKRCGSGTDCGPTGDNRYVPECRYDPDSDYDPTEVERICVARYKDISCNPMAYTRVGNEDHPLAALREDLGADGEHRDSCVTENDEPARRGCPRRGSGCAEGLVARADGICDTQENPETPAYAISQVPPPEDVEEVDRFLDTLDAFCQSFFCDDTFVCDLSDFSCVKCDPDLPYGAGGCGRIYSGGEPSCVYPRDLQAVCEEEDASVDRPQFGDCR